MSASLRSVPANIRGEVARRRAGDGRVKTCAGQAAADYLANPTAGIIHSSSKMPKKLAKRIKNWKPTHSVNGFAQRCPGSNK